MVLNCLLVLSPFWIELFTKVPLNFLISENSQNLFLYLTRDMNYENWKQKSNQAIIHVVGPIKFKWWGMETQLSTIKECKCTMVKGFLWSRVSTFNYTMVKINTGKTGQAPIHHHERPNVSLGQQMNPLGNNPHNFRPSKVESPTVPIGIEIN